MIFDHNDYVNVDAFVSNCYLSNLFIYCTVFFVSSRRRHTKCALVTGVQTCALPILIHPIWSNRRAREPSGVGGARMGEGILAARRRARMFGDVAEDRKSVV